MGRQLLQQRHSAARDGACGILGQIAALCRLWRVDSSGASATEFAIIVPALIFLLLGIATLGLAFNNYIELTNAASAGARQLSIGRGTTTPYSSTVTVVDNAAPNLVAGKITLTATVAGTACSSDGSTCQGAYGTGGGQATLSLSYPCSLNVGSLIKFTGCTLTAKSSEIIE